MKQTSNKRNYVPLQASCFTGKGGLKVLRQAQLPKWRGYFKWQIEARIVDLQAEHARLRVEAANGEG